MRITFYCIIFTLLEIFIVFITYSKNTRKPLNIVLAQDTSPNILRSLLGRRHV